jgi:hypothetical protein
VSGKIVQSQIIAASRRTTCRQVAWPPTASVQTTPEFQESLRNEAAIRARVAISPVVASHNHDFVVDGLAVGAAVRPDSPVYRAYKCRPSDEFPGFTWCAIKHPMSGRFGPYDSWVTILHSDTNIWQLEHGHTRGKIVLAP